MAVLGSSRRLTAALIAATCIESIEARAQDATWLASPSSNNFTSGANWSTGSVPSGTAFFGNSNTTTINTGFTPAIDGMTFNADAPAYVFNGPVRFGGAGIVNNSPFAPTFNNVGLFSLLSFNNGATAGNAVINNSGTLVFNQSATADRATITNSGTLNFNATSSAGNATITNQDMINFSGSSTAGSATIVTNSGGTTDFFRNADGGTARLITNAGGTVDVSGLGFRVLGSMSVGSIEGAGSYVLGDSILSAGTNNLSTTVSGVISGVGGQLIKIGTGTLTLTGANTFTGGTTVNGGSINFSAANNFGTGPITLNGGGLQWAAANTIDISSQLAPLGTGGGIFDTNGNNVTLASAVSGPGGLTKQGSGTLTLTGTNIYSGGTTVLGGILQGDSTSLQGNILNNAAVVFNQTGSGTYAGNMSGSGDLTKTGTGTLTMSGVNTFTGGTTVNGGALMVTGSLASGVTVNDGGLLGGSGTVGGATINSGGIIQPGPGFVPLNVMGTFTQNPGSTYIVTVNPAGQSNLINVTGSAVLNGGTVSAQFAPGEYANNTKYTILSATGGVSGTFSGLTTRDFAFLTPSLAYDPNNVFLNLTFNGFESGARMPDERAVAFALDAVAHTATGDLGKVIAALEELSTADAPAALDAIDGQPYANLGTVYVQTGNAFLNTIRAQTAASRGGPIGGGTRASLAQACDVACDASQPARWGAWLGGVGGLGSVPGDGNAGTLTYNFGGPAVGLDYRVNPELLVGLGTGYVAGTQWVNGFLGRATTDAFSASLYASFTSGPLYVDASAGYAHFWELMTRPIVIPGLSAMTAQGQVTADQFLGQLEMGYKIPLPFAAEMAISPFARLQGSTTNQAAVSERGANSLSLNVAPQITSSLRTILGADLSASLGNSHKVDVDFRLGWQHEFADTSRPITAAFAGAPGDAFTVFGATPQRDSASIGLGLRTHVTDGIELYARYDGEVGGGTDNHAFSAGLRITW